MSARPVVVSLADSEFWTPEDQAAAGAFGTRLYFARRRAKERPSGYVSPSEGAEIVGVIPRHIYGLAQRGAVRSVKTWLGEPGLGTPLLWLARADLQAYSRRRSVVSRRTVLPPGSVEMRLALGPREASRLELLAARLEVTPHILLRLLIRASDERTMFDLVRLIENLKGRTEDQNTPPQEGRGPMIDSEELERKGLATTRCRSLLGTAGSLRAYLSEVEQYSAPAPISDPQLLGLVNESVVELLTLAQRLVKLTGQRAPDLQAAAEQAKAAAGATR